MWIGKLLFAIMALNAFWFLFCYSVERVAESHRRERLSASNKLSRKG